MLRQAGQRLDPAMTDEMGSIVSLRDADPRQIVCFGGGGFSMEAGNPLLDDYVLEATGKRRPRVCFLPAASGDADHYIVRFYRAFAASRCEPSHISLFRRDGGDDHREQLLSQDLIYVGGGSIISLLGVLRAHGIDEILREAWRRGIVMCGLSAGSLCWFSEAITAFHGRPRIARGLGFLPWSNCVHYDDDSARGAAYNEAIQRGLCPGYAAGDGVALHFSGTRLVRAVSSRPDAKAFCVTAGRGGVRKLSLSVAYLGEAPGERSAAHGAKSLKATA
jgi:dipeptidase E